VITAILFTDLADAQTAPPRADEERAQDLLRVHHDLLSDVVRDCGGSQEVRSLGDGLVVAFASASDAVEAAVAMQQAARRPVGGVRLPIRVGLNVGETLQDDREHFGTTVVVARRLCDQARSGQILCSALVVELLARGRTFRFQGRRRLCLDGVATPVDACEVLYDDVRALGAPSSVLRQGGVERGSASPAGEDG
jgi:class 3 adenylate cyclase